MLAMSRRPDSQPPQSQQRGAEEKSVAALAALLGAALRGEGSVRLRGVQQDSRRVEAGDLFVALRGATSDGARYAASAVERGAAALMIDRDGAQRLGDMPVPVVEVDQPREALARAAAWVYGEPTQAMNVVGITGTNGKTTCAHLIDACLRAAGVRPGIVGTLGYRFEQLTGALNHTSPEADELQRIAANMRQAGATHVVMEVSSIALAAQRVRQVSFDVAVFTNLSQDHLDYHGSMRAYAEAKERLFLEHEPSVVVINIDDPYGEALADRLAQLRPSMELLRVTAQARPQAAQLWPKRVETTPRGIALELCAPSGELELFSPLIGAHNVSNLLCTLGVVEGLGLDLALAAKALEQLEQVAGRLERCDDPNDDDIVAVVDYAHTPDALARVLASLRPLTQGRLWCVFGCGGDRDRDKRAPMGEAVARGADVAVVTNDNPRSEDPSSIASAVCEGLKAGGAEQTAAGRRDSRGWDESARSSRFWIELDRAHAIAQVVAAARAGDLVLIAGKGHEPYQIIGAAVASFDDREQLRTALAKRRRSSAGGGH